MALACLPPLVQSRVFITGGQDGVMRVSLRCYPHFKLVGTWKPHKGPITAIAVSPDGSRIVTGGLDDTIFFFDVKASDLSCLCASVELRLALGAAVGRRDRQRHPPWFDRALPRSSRCASTERASP